MTSPSDSQKPRPTPEQIARVEKLWEAAQQAHQLAEDLTAIAEAAFKELDLDPPQPRLPLGDD